VFGSTGHFSQDIDSTPSGNGLEAVIEQLKQSQAAMDAM
jgi:hypothetical protein